MFVPKTRPKPKILEPKPHFNNSKLQKQICLGRIVWLPLETSSWWAERVAWWLSDKKLVPCFDYSFSCWYVLLLHLENTLLFVPILVLSLIASSCLPSYQVLRSRVSVGQWVSLPTSWESRPINLKSKFIRCRPTLGLGTSDWHFQLIMTKCTDMTHSLQNCAHSNLKVCIIWQANITELSCSLVSVQP